MPLVHKIHLHTYIYLINNCYGLWAILFHWRVEFSHLPYILIFFAQEFFTLPNYLTKVTQSLFTVVVFFDFCVFSMNHNNSFRQTWQGRMHSRMPSVSVMRFPDNEIINQEKCYKLGSISFPEPTCLLVSTKTRSSGIINKVVPQALVSFAFKI